MNTLTTRFARSTRVMTGREALTEDVMRAAAPSIFATDKHGSRSARYTYIPTIEVLRGLRSEGFEAFYVAQSRSRVEGKTEFTKHMVRLRHADQQQARDEAPEVILINSHDGTSSYQMLAGLFRFVCCNGLVAGQVAQDIRVPHKGDIQGEVIDGACRVMADFESVQGSTEGMKALTLSDDEQRAFATAALQLRFEPVTNAQGVTVPAPVSAEQMLNARRPEDLGGSLWQTFNRVQENAERGGLRGRSANGRNRTTRELKGLDARLSLNRALWTLAEEMRKLKGATWH